MVNDDTLNQWWYDSVVGVDPSDGAGNTAYVGGVDLWETRDGGTTWTNRTNAYQLPNEGTFAGVFPNQHAMAFWGPSASMFVLGADGGPWTGADSGPFLNMNTHDLAITQFYDGSIGEVGSFPTLYGGAQDTGEDQGGPEANAPWNQVFPGDAGDTVVDYTNNAIVYEETPYGGIHKSTDGGTTWTTASNGLGDTLNSLFIMPFIMSPGNHNELVAGTDRVYRTTNGGASWAPISPVLNPALCNFSVCPISALAIAQSNDQVIFAADQSGYVARTLNGGVTWSYSSAPLGFVTGLAVDPTNASIVYATVGGFVFSGTGQHVFKSTDAGIHWTDMSVSLPNIPFESVVVSPANAQFVIVGSDAGVFASQDGGTTWAQLGLGLPNAAINKVFMDRAGRNIYVATHGRGMWVLGPSHLQASLTAVNLTTAPGAGPGYQSSFYLSNPGAGTLNWTTNSLPAWVTVSPSSGTLFPTQEQLITLNFNTPSDTPQTYTTNLIFSDPQADNSPLTIPITVVSANVSKTWYFAEGFTGTGFTEYLTLANPNNDTNTVTVQYLLQGAPPITKQFNLQPNSRATINVNSSRDGVGPGQNVAVAIKGALPLIAERPMYFNFGTIPGGSDVLGATSLSTDFDFGYLDTTANHHTYLTILNPDPNNNMDVQISYFPAAGGDPIVVNHTVQKNSRGTVVVNTEPGLPAGTYSALVHLSQKGLVERPMYLKDATTGFTGAGDVVGVAQPLTDWDFAEGFVSSTFTERYILSNPSTTDTATGSVTFFLASGSPVTTNFTLAPGQQKIINAGAVSGVSGNNSAHVHADHAILAERFMSFKFGISIPGATDVLGAAQLSNLFYFAEGFTGKGFSEYLTIENPSATDTATVQVTFLPADGKAPVVRVYTIAPSSRFTLNTASVVSGASFSMVVESNVSIVTERPMYFTFGGTIPGGSDVVGYQP